MKIIKRKVPKNAEEHVVRSYRSQVWGTTINGSLGLPAGVALAAETLGFFGDQVMDVSVKEPWIRLSSTRGEILAKHTGQSMERIHADTDRDFVIEANEAVEYGIIDSVISSRELTDRSGPIR
jgi:ATP-dependent Clp protease protease subunit